MDRLIRLVKPFLAQTLYREGTIATILRGPAWGLRYRIFPDYGLSPLWGAWEPALQRLLVKHLRPGGVAYDIGANYGIHTLLMARLVGPSGHVFAFEPMPAIFNALCENIHLNQFGNCTCVPMALDNRNGTVDFVTGHHGGAGHFADVGNNRTGALLTVPTTTLDDFVYGGDGHRPPGLVKIDIEGAESRALQGAQRVLREARPVFFMDLHGADQQTRCGHALSDNDYDVFAADDGRQIRDVSSPFPVAHGMSDQIVAIPRGR